MNIFRKLWRPACDWLYRLFVAPHSFPYETLDEATRRPNVNLEASRKKLEFFLRSLKGQSFTCNNYGQVFFGEYKKLCGRFGTSRRFLLFPRKVVSVWLDEPEAIAALDLSLEANGLDQKVLADYCGVEFFYQIPRAAQKEFADEHA